ncbi:MAG: hypothetical protein IPL65_20600 [Lewinellaceae bacterium]|nr:hypothetical protein [Lewinellaceae bacterium]
MNTLSETLLELHRKYAVVDLRIDDKDQLWVEDNPIPCRSKGIRLVWTRRFEGQSNPDDLAVLYGLQLPDGQVGVLVDGYGPASDPDVTTFILGVQPLGNPIDT